MIPELGSFCLILALCLSGILGSLPLLGARYGISLWMHLARPLAAGVFVFLGLSLAILAHAFVTDDFTVQFVAQHSNSLLPLRYKMTALWGGHEGSFLLWTFMLAGWLLAVAATSRRQPLDFVARVLAVLGLLIFAYILFMLATSNPFTRMVPLPPADGADLNPALQDIGFILHPPTLYMGYVGFSVVFAFAMAALLSGRLDTAWARWCRPWANMAWAILTAGIALGSWWAYYELGWGGWWAWDPVENPPLITWLLGTALLHSLAVTEKRGVFKSWTVLLAILTFSGSLLGTFITRSGLLTSVHAFASDPDRGFFILGILGIAIGGALLLYGLRAPLMPSRAGFAWLSREMFLLTNNVILVVAAASVFLGTLFPLVYQALTDELISIGPPYFNTIFVPLMLLLLVLLGIGPVSRWKQTSTSFLVARLGIVLLVSMGLGIGLPWLMLAGFSLPATVTLVFALWVLGSIIRDLLQKAGNKPSLGRGLAALTLGYYGMQTAHLGVVVMLIGIALTSYFSLERSVLLDTGDSVVLGGYEFSQQGSSRITGPNYQGDEVVIQVSRGGEPLLQLLPQRRLYLVSGTPSTEMAIAAGLLRDLFVTLGEQRENGAWAMTIYVKPFVRWIWLGAVLMALGATLAALDKRYRRLRAAAATDMTAALDATPMPASTTAPGLGSVR